MCVLIAVLNTILIICLIGDLITSIKLDKYYRKIESLVEKLKTMHYHDR